MPGGSGLPSQPSSPRTRPLQGFAAHTRLVDAQIAAYEREHNVKFKAAAVELIRRRSSSAPASQVVSLIASLPEPFEEPS